MRGSNTLEFRGLDSKGRHSRARLDSDTRIRKVQVATNSK